MADLATLGIKIDATEVTPAATKLDGLAVSGKGAALATDQLTFSAGAMSAALKASGGDITKATALLVAQSNTEKVLQASVERVALAQTATGRATVAAQEVAAASTVASAETQIAAHGAIQGSSLKIRESLVLLREASRGNFTRMAGSASILLGAFGLIEAVLLPVIAAAAVLGVVFEAATIKINEGSGNLTKNMDLTEKQLARLKKQGIDTSVSLLDTFKATFQVLASDVFGAGGPLSGAGGFISSVFNNLMYAAKASVVFIVGGFVGAYEVIVSTWSLLPAALGDAVINAANITISTVQDMLNKAAEAFVPFLSIAHMAGIGNINLGQISNKFEGAGLAMGSGIINGFKKAQGETEAVLDKFFDDVADKARKNALARIIDKAGAAGTPKGQGQVNSAIKQLAETKNQLDAQNALNVAVANGTLSQREADEQLKVTNSLKSLEAEIDATKSIPLKNALKAIYAELLPVQKELVASQREWEDLKALDSQEQQNALLKVEISLAGQSNDARTIAIAQFKELQRLGLKPGDAQTPTQKKLIAGAGSNAEAALNLGRASLQGANDNAGASMATTAAKATLDSDPDAYIKKQKAAYAEIAALVKARTLTETQALRATAAVDAEISAQRLQNASSFFGDLATLSQSSNKTLAAIGKAAAITQATIDGVVAVQKALSAYPPPINYVMAAGVGIAAAANVAKIAGFEGGGYTGNGATDQVAGVTHGQEFVSHARATARFRPMLEAMNNGTFQAANGNSPLSVAGPGQGMKLVIEHHGTAQTYEQAPGLTHDEVRLIARDEDAKNIPMHMAKTAADHSSNFTRTMKNQYLLTRRMAGNG